MAKHSERKPIPEDVTTLIEILISEIQSPADLQSLLDRLPASTTCGKEIAALIQAKDRAERRQGFVKNEALWFSKYGWFMARVVILFGLIAAGLTLITRGAGIDVVTYLILGAAGYYLLLFTLSNVRYREGNRKRAKVLEQEKQKYQREIVPVASALLKRFHIEASRFPILNPPSRAGLEEREDGIYIPLN